MPATLAQTLKQISQQPAILSTLTQLNRGIEKESLRCDSSGLLAQSAHPESLGSPLTHSKITTDYSEALLEFITPVQQSVSSCLQTLNDIHSFTVSQLAKQNELLWQASMPCILSEEKDIPVAQYGTSNVAKMKTVYRLGLGLRYGRIMQTISGVHYNFSLNEKFWANYQKMLGDTQTISQFKSEQYFNLIRNFKRLAPIFVYLFGASPALCKSFIKNQNHQLQSFDEHSWHLPYATSLRMGDLGYQSKAQESLFVCYNSLENYIDTLRKGILEPYPSYAQAGTKDARGNYQQLNTSLLQIENEFYSIIRPKRVAASGEAPVNALARSGVEYVEIRCIDVNPFAANGVSSETLRFLDLLLLYCLFSHSPEAKPAQCKADYDNLRAVVNQGRDPKLCIEVNGEQQHFHSFAKTTLADMQQLADMLDSLRANAVYRQALQQQQAKLDDSSLTPSAKVLATMRDKQQSYSEFALEQSKHWQQHFLNQPLDSDNLAIFEELSANSIASQKAIEAANQQSFDDYLTHYYKQY